MDFYVHIYNTFPVEVLLFGFPFFSADRCENKYTHSHLSTPHSYSHSPTFSLAYSLYFVLDRTRHISRAHSELSLSSCFCLFCDSVSKKFIFGGYPAWEKPTDMRQSVPPKEMGWMCVCVDAERANSKILNYFLSDLWCANIITMRRFSHIEIVSSSANNERSLFRAKWFPIERSARIHLVIHNNITRHPYPV